MMSQVLTELAFAFGIMAICVVIHSATLVNFSAWLITKRPNPDRSNAMLLYSLLLILSFFVLIVLHLVETTIWGIFYYWRGLFPDFETSLYFSLGSYTTIGYGDVVLPQRWRMLGGIEGLSGVLLCGLSAAFVFALVNSAFQFRVQQRAAKAASS
jgi:voltage-gated potassium channel Kch